MLKINWKEKSWKFKLGVILILVSILFFILLLIIPFSNISDTYKITITSISFILAEILFYSGGFLLGKEIFNKYKALLNPRNWFKKKVSVNVTLDDKTDKIKHIH